MTQDELKKLLHYDPISGIFTWLKRPELRGKASAWNVRWVGRVAGAITPYGYVLIRIKSLQIFAHRLAFLYMEGSLPPDCVDHINRDRADNRWVNLRHADHTLNNNNRPKLVHQRNNTSGVTGVSFRKNRGTWTARIAIRGKRVTLGHFHDFAEAVTVRKQAEIEHGY